MGCWNETCMISGLPIECGDEVKLVLLVKNGELINNNIYYPTDLFSPLSFPITGVYDDYGGVEDVVEDLNFDIINSYLKSKYKTIIAGDGECDDFDLTTLIENIERGNDVEFLTKDDKIIKSNFYFAMVRSDIWNGIIDFSSVKNGLRAIHERSFDSKVSKLIHDATVFGMSGAVLRLNNSFTLDNTELECSNILLNILIGNDDEAKKTIRNEIIELEIINSFLYSTRKIWMITSGCGSQHSSWKDYISLNNLVNKICAENINL